ncbi:MAG: hypothetical protein DRQ89_15330 [Epsilonproteobacteria bacterium]|nr:MAG: hypothetical protein DRQ89_15330 [Campylobacterota bacterium]
MRQQHVPFIIDWVRFCLLGMLVSIIGACVTQQTIPTQSITQRMVLTVHWAEPWEVTEKAHGYGYGGQKAGFAIFGPTTCHIYAPKPRHADDHKWFSVVGHEILHCTDGNWHE